MAYTILRTTLRNALCITDGQRVGWIQGRWMRPDGTLTPMGQMSFAASTQTLEDYNREQEERARREAQAREEREAQRNERVTYIISAWHYIDEGASSHRVWDGRRYQILYGRRVKSYDYIPKSVTTVERDGDTVKLTMPRWLADRFGWMREETPIASVIGTDEASVMARELARERMY